MPDSGLRQYECSESLPHLSDWGDVEPPLRSVPPDPPSWGEPKLWPRRGNLWVM
jgi:hypothetical protein